MVVTPTLLDACDDRMSRWVDKRQGKSSTWKCVSVHEMTFSGNLRASSMLPVPVT